MRCYSECHKYLNIKMYKEGWIVIVCLLVLFWKKVETSQKNKVFVVCVSGYRYDYINELELEAIARFNEEGVSAPYVRPIYPALPYPNLYSIATGLYAENHGIIGEIMYDQKKKEFYQPSTERNATKMISWNIAEPIWTTAEKHGFRTALYWWPGCEMEVDGVHPSVCEPHRLNFDPSDFKHSDQEKLENIKNNVLERINDVIQMFKHDELELAFLYYDFIEQFNLIFGPNSEQRKSAIRDVDNILLRLMELLDSFHLQDKVNILLLSDTGVTNVDDKTRKYLDLNKYQENIKFQLMFGSLSMLLPVPGKEEKLFLDLKHENFEGLDLFKKEDIPNEYHIKESKRTLPILLQAHDNFFINPLRKKKSEAEPDPRVKGPNYGKFNGMNGYNPFTEKNMNTIFFAKGPAFKKSAVSMFPLSSIDMYNIICRALEMKGLPNNGTQSRIDSIFLVPEVTTDDSRNDASTMKSFYYLFFFFIYAYVTKFLNA